MSSPIGSNNYILIENYFQTDGSSIEPEFAGLLQKFIFDDSACTAYCKQQGLLDFNILRRIKDKAAQLRFVLEALVEVGDLAKITTYLSSLDSQSKAALWQHRLSGETILFQQFAERRDENILLLLLKEGATLGESYIDRFRVLQTYISSPHLSTYYPAIIAGLSSNELLLMVNLRNREGQTLLHLGVKNHIRDAMLCRFIKDGALLLQDDRGRTPIHEAASDAQMIDKIPFLLTELSAEKKLEAVNLQDTNGQTPLVCAVNQGISVIYVREFLLSFGAKIDPRKCSGRADFSPLHYAILTDASLEICQELFHGLDEAEKRAFVNRQDREGFTSLHYAVNRRRDENIIRLLLNAGASPSIQSNLGYSPVHSAVFGCAKIIAILLENESPEEQVRIVRLKDQKGNSALTYTFEKGRSARFYQIPILLQLGADSNDLKNPEISPLLFALITHASRQEVVAILNSLNPQELEIELNSTSIDGLTLLHKAIYCAVDPDMIELLVQYGAKSKAALKEVTPFHLVDFKSQQAISYYQALLSGNSATIPSSLFSLLVDNNADPALIAFLVQRGCQVNISHLFSASRQPSALNLCKLLLSLTPSNEKEVMLSTSFASLADMTLLETVFLTKKVDPVLVRFLVEEGAQVTSNVLKAAVASYPRSLEIWLALLEPLSQHKREIAVNLRIEEGLKIKGRTILHFAGAEYFDIEIMKLLIKFGAPLNAQDENGDTPLHHVAVRRKYRLIKLFLTYGADPNILNHKNRRALDDPDRFLSSGRINEIRWSHFSFIEDNSKRILEFHHENPKIKDGDLLILSGKSDHNGAYTLYSDCMNVNLEVLISLSQVYRTTCFKVVEHEEEMIAAIQAMQGEVDIMFEGHGFGEKGLPTRMRLGENYMLTTGNQRVLSLLQEKCMNRVIIYSSCEIGREGEPITIPQEAASSIAGVTVIASEESFDMKDVKLFPEELIKIRFFNGERDLTAVYQNGQRLPPHKALSIEA